MKLNTHDRTPRPKNSKLVTCLFVMCFVLNYLMFGPGAFAVCYYGKSVVGGLLVLAVPVVFTLAVGIPVSDIKKAYVEISDNNIYVVDYYFGIRKEKHFICYNIYTNDHRKRCFFI